MDAAADVAMLLPIVRPIEALGLSGLIWRSRVRFLLDGPRWIVIIVDAVEYTTRENPFEHTEPTIVRISSKVVSTCSDDCSHAFRINLRPGIGAKRSESREALRLASEFVAGIIDELSVAPVNPDGCDARPRYVPKEGHGASPLQHISISQAPRVKLSNEGRHGRVGVGHC